MSVMVDKNVVTELRDGTRLRADIYRPADGGEYPVLLQRTPYNKELWPITALTLDPIRAAAAGYAVVIQDVRGRWASEGGVFYPYRDEREDGYDSVDWCAPRPFSSGKVGCYGLSYMGGTSWLAAQSGHTSLGAISPTTAPNDFWRNHFWRGGALNIGTLVMWALRAIGPAAMVRAADDPAALGVPFAQLFDDIDGFDAVVRALPLESLAAAKPEDEKFLPFYFDFLKYLQPSAETDALLLSSHHEQVKVPSLSIAGWHDLLLAADLEHFSGMRERAGSEAARAHSRLIVGPWAHGMFQNVVGELDFGFRANGLFLDLKEDLTRLQLRWFDRWLKGERNGVEDEAPVRLFVQGINRWRDESDWPPRGTRSTAWYLHAQEGFSSRAPEVEVPPTSFVSDPNDPCPTLGGNLLLPQQYAAGPVDQRQLLSRRDVVQFVSSPLEADLEMIGPVTMTLFASTSGQDCDWVVKLCDVWPDGRVMNVCDGILRASLRDGRERRLIQPGEILEYTIDLWATAQVFGAGHRLAVLITSSDFPRYDRNPNTGEPASSATRLEAVVQRIYHDRNHPTHLQLPAT